MLLPALSYKRMRVMVLSFNHQRWIVIPLCQQNHSELGSML